MTAKKILVIDDDAGVRFTMKRILTSAGFEVFEAPDGKKAMELFSLARPDLIITDIIMPEQEGIETIVALKHRIAKPPIIAISGGGRIGNQDLLRMAERLGADASLRKPFGEAELIALVREKLAA